MAQTGFTPIQLYSTSTAAAVPVAGNLTNSTLGSELAINITDGKLFYKDNANAVQVIANKLWIGTVTSVSGTSPVAVANGTSTPVISLSAGYGDTQNPYASKTANNFLAAPNGSPGAPTFRAIVAADIPTLNQNTTGSAATLTTARNLWGQSFNGSADISAPLYPAVGSVSLPAYSASGDTNTGIFFPAADTIAFAEGGVEALRIDSSANVGIGTTTANNKLQSAYTVPASAPSAGAGAHGFAVGSGGFGLAAGALTSGKSYLQGTRWDGIAANYNLVLQPNGNDVEIGNGNLVIATSGKGIDFSATPGTGTSELFDDYEEGTFTPSIAPGAGSITSSTTAGSYTKVGDILTVHMTFTIVNGGTASGNLGFSNLPFTAKNLSFQSCIFVAREVGVGFANYFAIGNSNATTGTLISPIYTNGAIYNMCFTYLVV